MRIGWAAIAAGVMVAAAGCGGSGGVSKDTAMQTVWNSFDTVGQKAFCEAAIQDGENFYGPARGLASKAGNGVTEYDAQQFLLQTCPDAWLLAPDRF